MDKFFKVRVQSKKDSLENWELVKDSFIALDGEFLIVTNIDENTPYGLKIGDGISTFAQLPYLEFGGSSGSSEITINGVTSNSFTITPASIGALAADGKAVDSAKADYATTAADLSSTLAVSKGGTGGTTILTGRSGLGANRIVVSSTQPASGTM